MEKIFKELDFLEEKARNDLNRLERTMYELFNELEILKEMLNIKGGF